MFAASGVDRSADATLEQIDIDAALAEIKAVTRAHRPVSPRSASKTGNMFSYGFAYEVDGMVGQVTSRLERSIATISRSVEEGGPWTPKTYLAITETAAPGTLGVEGASEEASFHIIMGKW